MIQLMQIVADSIYFFFVAFESMLFELDNITIFDYSGYEWSIVFIVISWMIGLLADLFNLEWDAFVGKGDIFND
jgi:hypothetical protein